MKVVGNSRLTGIADLERMRQEILSRYTPSARSVHICMGPGCAAKGSHKLYELFCEAVSQAGAKCTSTGQTCWLPWAVRVRAG